MYKINLFLNKPENCWLWQVKLGKKLFLQQYFWAAKICDDQFSEVGDNTFKKYILLSSGNFEMDGFENSHFSSCK